MTNTTTKPKLTERQKEVIKALQNSIYLCDMYGLQGGLVTKKEQEQPSIFCDAFCEIKVDNYGPLHKSTFYSLLKKGVLVNVGVGTNYNNILCDNYVLSPNYVPQEMQEAYYNKYLSR